MIQYCIFTARKRSLRRFFFFTPVCQSFCSQEGVPGQVPPLQDQVHPRDQVHLLDQVHPRTRYTPLGRYSPLDQVHPLGRYTPLDQVHPPGPVHPLDRYTFGTRYTPCAVHPLEPGTPPGPGTPPDQVHPPGPGMPPRLGTPPWDQVHPPGTRYTPRDQVHPPETRYTPQAGTPSRAVHAGTYGHQAGGTYPTGMHSCITFLLCLLFVCRFGRGLMSSLLVFSHKILLSSRYKNCKVMRMNSDNHCKTFSHPIYKKSL